MMLRESKDVKVRGTKVKIRTGRKWKAEEAVKEAETRLWYDNKAGTTISRGLQEQLINIQRTN